MVERNGMGVKVKWKKIKNRKWKQKYIKRKGGVDCVCVHHPSYSRAI